MEKYVPAFEQICRGQFLIVLCCIVYLIWWSISFRPGETVNRIGGVRGVLLLLTAVLGIAGVILNAHGNGMVPREAEAVSGTVFFIGGAAAYLLLLLVTGVFLKRPVTTELFLITWWTVLELMTLNALNGAGFLSGGRLAFLVILTAAACAVSLVIYMLYYRMEAWKAFYAAMVPLITEGICMAVVLLLVRRV